MASYLGVNQAHAVYRAMNLQESGAVLNSRSKRGIMMTVLLVLSAFLINQFISGVQGQTIKTAQVSGFAQKIRYEDFGPVNSTRCLILLHGASGPTVALYRDQASFFGNHGFHVLMPYFFDASRSESPSPENYQKWVNVVAGFVSECRKQAPSQRVFVLGYSLGSSVALAAGSQGLSVDAIADWYGSLPDEFFYQMKSMPPLLILHGERDTNIPIINAQQLVKLCDIRQLRCDHHFYTDQGHGFYGTALEDADQRTLAFFAKMGVPAP
jgi:dienelactone hydrolase